MLIPQLTTRFGLMRNISLSKPRRTVLPPVRSSRASPRTSTPRTFQGLYEAISSTTIATLGLCCTSCHFLRRAIGTDGGDAAQPLALEIAYLIGGEGALLLTSRF